MLKTHAILEVQINERIYQLHLPSDAPLGEVHDVLYRMKGYVIDKILESQKTDAQKDSPPEPEVKVE